MDDQISSKINDIEIKLAKMETLISSDNGLVKQMTQLRKDYRRLSRNQFIAIGFLMALKIVLKFIPLPL